MVPNLPIAIKEMFLPINRMLCARLVKYVVQREQNNVLGNKMLRVAMEMHLYLRTYKVIRTWR